MTKSINGNHKNYSFTNKSGIKRDMGRKNMRQTEDDRINPARVNPSDVNPD